MALKLQQCTVWFPRRKLGEPAGSELPRIVKALARLVGASCGTREQHAASEAYLAKALHGDAAAPTSLAAW